MLVDCPGLASRSGAAAPHLTSDRTSPCQHSRGPTACPVQPRRHSSALPSRKARTAQRIWAGRTTVSIEKTDRNTRNCYACVYIPVPLNIVWEALTDYDNLGTFIPGLAENRCLSRTATGARILQVGEQSVALGARFRAKVVLDCQEHKSGLPVEVHVPMGDGTQIPQPRAPVATAPQDIMFHLVEGDFQVFQGVWRMQPEAAGGTGTWLSYALHVKPPPWMPVRLIQGRIESEIAGNLQAVKAHSEQQWAAQRAMSGV